MSTFFSISPKDRPCPSDELDAFKCDLQAPVSVPVSSTNTPEEEIEQAILIAVIRSSAGLDGIPTDFPNAWKQAVIHPIPKVGSNEYRPISLVSQLAKVSERVITWLMEQQVHLRDSQFGCHEDVMSAIDASRFAQHYSASYKSQGLKFAGIFSTKAKLTIVYTQRSSSISYATYAFSPWIQAWLQSWLSQRCMTVQFHSFWLPLPPPSITSRNLRRFYS